MRRNNNHPTIQYRAMVEPKEKLVNVQEECTCKNVMGSARSSGREDAHTSSAQQQCRPVPEAAAYVDADTTDKQHLRAKNSDERTRRNRVYESLLRKWMQAAPSAEPRPRSSHPRVLGGQALTTRQVCAS